MARGSGEGIRKELGSERNPADSLLHVRDPGLLPEARRAPGTGPGPHEEDLPPLKAAAVALLAEVAASPGPASISDDLTGLKLKQKSEPERCSCLPDVRCLFNVSVAPPVVFATAPAQPFLLTFAKSEDLPP